MTPNPPAVLFFKSPRYKDRPGYRLENRRWHSITAYRSHTFAPVKGSMETRGDIATMKNLEENKIPETALRVVDSLMNVQAVRLPPTGSDIRERGLIAARKTAEYMRRNNLAILNHHSGALINLTTSGLKHAKSHTGDSRAAALLFRLPSALARAIYCKSEIPDPRKEGRTHIVAYHKFVVPVMTADETGLALAILHVKEDNRARFYYDAAIGGELKKLDGKPPGPDITNQPGDRETGRHRAYLETITSLLQVKPGLGRTCEFFRKSMSHSARTTPDAPDSTHCSCHASLEALHKSLPAESDTSIWRPHDNPWLTDLCEEFSQRGAERLLALQSALFLVLGLPADEAMLRKADLPEGDRPGIQARFQKPLGKYTPADWSDLVDLLVRTHLHPDDLGAKADWLSFRAYLAGRVNALQDQLPGWKPMESLIALVTKPALDAPPPLSLRLHTAWTWARERIGMFLTNVSSSARFRIVDVISSHIQEQGLSARPALQSRLFDSFSALNRDWRRIAITEAGEVANQAYLGELAHGARIRRIEHYVGACPFCARLNGQEFIWSEQPLDESFGWTHVWPGKTNVGRSASPRKQTEDGLVERTEPELWWPAAGTQHPHCRGRWQEIPDPASPSGVDPKFHAWVQSELAAIRIPNPS